jgi:hypothetical protein
VWGAAYTAALTAVPLTASPAFVAVEVVPEALVLVVADGMPSTA